jgi:hypothetical protein
LPSCRQTADHRFGNWYFSIMLHVLKCLLICAGLFIVTFPGAAQDAANRAPDGAKLLENEQIKVRELQLKPGAKLPVQGFPNTFVYALTDGALVFMPPGRRAYELSFKAGEALWLSAQQAAMANETGHEIRALLVEIKQRPVAAARKGKAAGKASKGKAAAKSAAKGKKR